MDASELKSRFGKRVQTLREAKGLTQEQLAGVIGRSVDTVSNIERGINSTRIEIAHQIALELGVTLPDLFAFNSEGPKAEEREGIVLLLALVRDCDDATLRSVMDLVRAGLTLRDPSAEQRAKF